MKKLFIAIVAMLLGFGMQAVHAQVARHVNMQADTDYQSGFSPRSAQDREFIATFADEYSAARFKSGLNLTSSGMIVSLSGSVLMGLGTSIATGSDPETAPTTYVSGAVMTFAGSIGIIAGGIMTFVGVVRMNKWGFNGRGLVYNF